MFLLLLVFCCYVVAVVVAVVAVSAVAAVIPWSDPDDTPASDITEELSASGGGV